MSIFSDAVRKILPYEPSVQLWFLTKTSHVAMTAAGLSVALTVDTFYVPAVTVSRGAFI